MAEWGQVPFWACLTAVSAGSNSRRFNYTFACAVHRCLLEASPPTAGSLAPLRPCTPPGVYHAPNVGRRCHSSARRSGVGKLPCRTCMNTQLSKSRLTGGLSFATLPPLTQFRVNGSHEPNVRPRPGYPTIRVEVCRGRLDTSRSLMNVPVPVRQALCLVSICGVRVEWSRLHPEDQIPCIVCPSGR